MYDSLTCLLALDLDSLRSVCEHMNVPMLKEVEMEFLEEYCKVLAPLVVAIDKLQGEFNCSYIYVIPVINQVQTQLLKIQESNLKYNSELVTASGLVTATLAGLSKRLKSILNQDENDAMLATVSHPFFKMKPILKDKRDSLQALPVAEARILSPCNLERTTREGNRHDEYFEWSEDEEQGENSSSNLQAVEVLQFFNNKDTDLEMLHKYPCIKKIYTKYNTPLPSSAPVERLFSFGSLILNCRRGQLSDSNFEKLLLLKANGVECKRN